MEIEHHLLVLICGRLEKTLVTRQWMSTEKPEADVESVSELCKLPVEDKTRLLDYGILHQENLLTTINFFLRMQNYLKDHFRYKV